MRNIIGIVSGKGGVGKTTITVNLAAALTELENRVVVVDGNISTSNIGIQLGIMEYPASLHKVLNGEMRIIDAVFIHPTKIHVIPGSLAIADARKTTVASIKKHLRDLIKHYDFVFVDTAPGLEERPLKIVEGCDNIFIVTTPELTSVTDTVRIIELLKSKRKNISGIIVNRYTGKDYEVTPEEIKALYKIPVIALIPEDENVRVSISEQVPLVLSKPDSPASKEFLRLASEITGRWVQKKKKGLF